MVKKRVVTVLWGIALGPLLNGCLSADRAPDSAPASPPAQVRTGLPSRAEWGAAGARVPIEQAMGVVIHDPARRARAFENGPVGQPPPSLAPVVQEVVAQKEVAPAAQTGGCNLPPGEPCDPPPPPPSLSVAPVAVDAVMLTYTCGTASTIVRTSPTFTPLSTNCFHDTMADTGLQPGTTYCYALMNSDGTLATATRCATTLFNPYVFNGPGISQTESDQMAAQFDWTHTNPVAATIVTASGTQTALYSMNILVKNADDLLGIRGLGIHTQTQPLLPGEQAAWDGTVMKAMAAGEPAGVWITAVVPGPVYNDLRSQAIAAIAQGQPFGIQAMVFRKINDVGAAFFPNTTIVPVGPLNPTFLGQQGFEFNGYSPVQCDNGNPRTCTIQQALLGWLLSKAISIVVDVVQAAVDGVRQIIGAIERLIVGEVDVTLQLALNNSDEAFGTGLPTRSGWNAGAPLVLKNLPVRVYQGVAEFTATTDANGVATLHVAKNHDGKVCVDLQNDRVTLIDTFVARRVCIGSFPGTSSATTVPIVTSDRYANVLATMTDAADYLHAVMNVDMAPISVLTGWQSSILTGPNGGLSFTPCMGRMPNLTANIAIYSSAIVSPLLTLLGEVSEFLNSYDIILAENDVRSRGVGVHEYGHAATCQLLRKTGDANASTAWADVIVATLGGQSASAQQSVIAESFADFLALQVVGGTNYFSGSYVAGSRGMSYCRGDSVVPTDCVEANAKHCTGTSCLFTDAVKWSASLLQDAFDHVPTDAERSNPPVNVPNDGSHWTLAGAILVPHHASNQVASDAIEADAIELAGPRMSDIFSAWAARGSVLRYDSFYGGLAQTLKSAGYSRGAVCAMFGAHELDGACPSYVGNVFGERLAYALADQPTAASYTPTAAHSGAGTVTIQHAATGLYLVIFDGLPAFGIGMSASYSVTAFGSSAITCSVTGVSTSGDASDVAVRCWDNVALAVADSPFSILIVGDSVLPSPSAFLSSGGLAPLQAPDATFSWTTGSHPETVTHNAATGDYNVNFGVGNAPLSAKLVTAFGANDGERCNDAQGISGGIEVKCYDRNGAPFDGHFFTAQIAGGRAGQRFGFAFANDRQSASYTPLTSTALNSSGGAILATRSSVGHYLIDFAGLQTQIGHTENVQVTGIGTALVTCNVVRWNNSADGLEVSVECRDGASQFVDARYEVMVIE